MQESQAIDGTLGADGLNSVNPLVAAANPLLNAIPQIRRSVSHNDISGLRQHLVDETRRFEVRCQQAGLSYETIIGARYCLCTALDEAAALTPWGSSGMWTTNGLLVTFHNETWGGEKFFQLLARLSQHPKQHIQLLELMNFCLQLGFEGRYRILDNGRSQLQTIKQRLWQMIRDTRGSYAQPLSPAATDKPVQRQLWHPVIPLWACAALSGLLLCLLYITLNWWLGDATSPVLAKIYQTPLPEVRIQQPAQAQPAMLNLRGFLQPEVDAGLVSVRDEADRSVVILKGDGLFDSGSTEVKARYTPVIDRIAQAMNEVSGNISVVGYSDNVPIRSARFASNYELSLARARSVQYQLQKHLTVPDRVKAEGRGEMDPLAPNTSATGRALNRRVEITLLVAPKNTQAEVNNRSQGRY